MSEETTTETTPVDSAPAVAADPQEPSTETPAPKPTDTVDFWKNKARDWETRSKENATKAKAYDQLQEQSKSELERAQDEAKRLADRADSFRNRAVLGEAKALATDFANPEVAVRLLGDLKGYVNDEGDIDGDRLKTDLAELLKREPYLARVTEPTGMRPNPAQGQSGNPGLTPSQVVTERERAGDWKAAGAIKADQLLQLAKNNK